jgi:hypothetical protein
MQGEMVGQSVSSETGEWVKIPIFLHKREKLKCTDLGWSGKMDIFPNGDARNRNFPLFDQLLMTPKSLLPENCSYSDFVAYCNA